MNQSKSMLIYKVISIPILTLFFFFLSTLFSVKTIQAPFLDGSSQTPSQEILFILNQPFHYLGKGKQSFAFVSEDHQYVLKFFNRSYFELPLYSLGFKKEKRDARKKYYQESYSLAERFLKKETGILYLHLQKTNIPLPTLTVTDQWNIPHHINLNQTPFVLQRKGEPLYATIEQLIHENKTTQAKELIDQFFALIQYRITQNIGDKDHNIEDNFGVLNGHILHLDPGRLYLDPSLQTEAVQQHQWWSATHRFTRWLKKNHPEYVQSD